MNNKLKIFLYILGILSTKYPFLQAEVISYSSVASQLSSGVKEIHSTGSGFGAFNNFAAIKEDGSVVVWGKDVEITPAIKSVLSANVTNLYNNSGAFAALKNDGSVLTWGNATHGGNSSLVSDKISSGVKKIVAFYNAFAALKSDGSVVVWGDQDQIQSWSTVSTELASGVEDLIGDDLGKYTSNGISSQGSYFWFYLIAKKSDNSEVLLRQNGLSNSNAILQRMTISGNAVGMELLDDGSLIQKWGGPSNPLSPDWPIEKYIPFDSVKNSLDSPVVFLSSSYAAFAALTETGKVVTWGDGPGANSSMVANELQSGVTDIINGAWTQWFLALKSNGSVVLWGDTGNNTQMANPNPEIRTKLKDGVVDIETTSSFQAIAALKSDGSVVVWGKPGVGGDPGSVAQYLNSGVSKLYATGTGFAALKNDGSVVAWGGDSSKVPSQLASGVVDIHAVWDGFYAIKKDGSVVACGKMIESESSSSNGNSNSSAQSGGSGGGAPSGGGGEAEKPKKGKKGSDNKGNDKKSSDKKDSNDKKSGGKKSDKKSSSGGNDSNKSGGKKSKRK